jgi:hypothetical protein
MSAYPDEDDFALEGAYVDSEPEAAAEEILDADANLEEPLTPVTKSRKRKLPVDKPSDATSKPKAKVR